MSKLDEMKEKMKLLEDQNAELLAKLANERRLVASAKQYGEGLMKAWESMHKAAKLADERYEAELQKNIDLERKLEDEQKIRQIMRQAMAEMSDRLKKLEEGYTDWVVLTNEGDAKHYFSQTDQGAAYLARQAGHSVYHVYTKKEYEAETGRTNVR
jgi:hypothetical protein